MSVPFLFFFILYTLLIFDPLGRPTITADSYHYFHTCCPSVSPQLSKNGAKQNNFKVRIVIATRGILGLAEGIIEDTCLVVLSFLYEILPFCLASQRSWLIAFACCTNVNVTYIELGNNLNQI